ncbi:OmpA family protein [methane-oxidizing endosymbiont of Gigantopelta aegis]|uniref:OmpA family protein n=1 Tax=methane-oxidizing endosymbiont of Gigantopelta aegis TaxID=2794938 RepID=UPI0018DD1761|nr:OmpA family protein [methane-oxidizing endosymbiont of Gigantopelta aegis]
MMTESDKQHHLASALALDDWLDEPDGRPTQNWLLTYIDVFVLIVMLVVVLISLSHFETQTKKPEKKFIKQGATVKKHPETTIKGVKTKSLVAKNSVQPDHKTPKRETTTQRSPKPSLTIKKLPVATVPVVKPMKQKTAQAIKAVETPKPAKKVNAPAPIKKADTDKTQRRLQQKLKKLGLEDKIQMTVSKGYAQLRIQDNILYQSSNAELSESGKVVLKRLTPLLQQSKGLIYIEGHTDNRPIKTAKFPSNWELGAARATSVLHFLAKQNIDPARMRAVTFADTQPIADNSTEEGRQKNRRVNIVIKVSDED